MSNSGNEEDRGGGEEGKIGAAEPDVQILDAEFRDQIDKEQDGHKSRY